MPRYVSGLDVALLLAEREVKLGASDRLLALTRLQADAFVTFDAKLAKTAARVVKVASAAELLGVVTREGNS